MLLANCIADRLSSFVEIYYYYYYYLLPTTTMHTMVRKNTQPELDSLWDAQLVKLS